MTLPASGLITLGDINEELGRSRTAAIQLDKAENGDYGTINTCSPFYPVAGNPAKISEWYGYNHNAVCSFSQKSVFMKYISTNTNSFLEGGAWSDISQDNPYFNQDDAGFSFCTWIQPIENNGTDIIGLFALGDSVVTANATITCSITNVTNPNGTKQVFLIIDIQGDSTGNSHRANFQAQLNDSNNSTITGISSSQLYGVGTGYTIGNTNNNNFSHIAVTYDSGENGTANAVNIYWNGSSLVATRPLFGQGAPDNTNWDQQVLCIGNRRGGGPGVCYDEYNFYYENCLTTTEISEIYNSGYPQNSSNYSFSYETCFYRFEDPSDLGIDSGNNGYQLQSSSGTSAPTSSTQHA
tara:strand:- start:7437 stop:8495 length:1059 start_codon:yes stop_codon:yes gene_type:complete